MWKLVPIVGEIRDKKASILFELYDKSSIINYSIDNKYVNHVKNESPTNAMIEFETWGRHKISWYVNYRVEYEHTITVSNNINQLIFVSCDLLEADTKKSLWHKIPSDDRTVIVHLGDQAYMDNVFNKSKTDLTNIYENYSDRYCDTWRPHAQLLSNTSNFFLWDDHEISNNINLSQVTDDIKVITDAATHAYMKYQQFFHVHQTYIINQYCWYKYLDETWDTVMLAIERTSEIIPIENIFESILYLDKINPIKRLILCFSSAPIPITNNELYIKLKGLEKFWNPVDLKILYEWLFDWMEAKEVVIVGGDVHFGIHGVVTKNDLKIPVLISSPITNQPYPDRVLASKGMGVHPITEQITFTTISSKARRCFATLDLQSYPMKTDMIYSKHILPKNIIKYLNLIRKF